MTAAQRVGAANALFVEASDNGSGISLEDQKHLFDRFFRTKSATTQAIQETGLGLPIVKTIVEGHGGTISVKSIEGEGTVFRVELPLACELVAA